MLIAATRKKNPVSTPCTVRVERLANEPDFYLQENLLTLRNTRVANLMGLASLALPVGVPSVGILLNVAGGDDARLLRIGAAAEAALA